MNITQPSLPPKKIPTKPPSAPPTHAPLAFGDFHREFSCSLSYFNALKNCPMHCPTGGDNECTTHPAHGVVASLGLKCMSGVADCKVENRFGAYGLNDTMMETTTEMSMETTMETEAGGGGCAHCCGQDGGGRGRGLSVRAVGGGRSFRERWRHQDGRRHRDDRGRMSAHLATNVRPAPPGSVRGREGAHHTLRVKCLRQS
jgi:hypothetical protein